MAGPYNFRITLVTDILPGGALRTLRNGTITIKDSADDSTVTTVTTDPNGGAVFQTASAGTVYYVTPSGYVSGNIISPDAYAESASAAASAASSAADAAASAQAAQDAANLVGAPADAAVEALVTPGSGSATEATLNATYGTKAEVDAKVDKTATGLTFGPAPTSLLYYSGGNTGVGYFVFKNGTATGASGVAVGNAAGASLTTANNPTYVGYAAGQYNSTSNETTYVGSYAGNEATGANNTALGARALCGPNLPRDASNPNVAISGSALTAWLANTPTGARNTAIGREAISTLGAGSDNTAVGYEAFGGQGAVITVTGITVSGTTVTVTVSDAGGLVVGEPFMFQGSISGFTSNSPTIGKLYNVTGKAGNTFTYEQSPAPVGTYTSGGTVLAGVISGNNNVAVGSSALFTNQRGSGNVAIGSQALYRHDVGLGNIGIGHAALTNQTNAANNVAVGQNAGFSITTGGSNVFVGRDAGLTATTANGTTTANNQVVVGYQAGQGSTTVSAAIVAVGAQAKASGNFAMAIGWQANANGAGGVAIGTDSGGAAASATAANEFVLGTANHRYKMPGLPTTNPGAGSGILWNNAGVVTVA